MAEALSERTLRRILRDKERERMLQQENEKREEKEKRRLEELERLEDEMIKLQMAEGVYGNNPEGEINELTGNESDKESELSDLDTINEFLHDTTSRDIREMQTPDKTLSQNSQKEKSNSVNKHFAFIDEYIERLDDTLGDIREHGSNIDREHRSNIDREGRSSYTKYNLPKQTEERKDRTDVTDRKYEDISYSNHEKGGKSTVRSDTRRKIYKSERDLDLELDKVRSDTRRNIYKSERDLDLELDKVRSEKEEMRSQSSRYERESLKLRKLQIEEEKKQLLIKQRDRQLLEELECKKRAEQELIERITLLENQEKELNKRRNENEALEREMYVKRKEDETLSMKIRLLKEKEKVLKQRLETRDNERIKQGDDKEGVYREYIRPNTETEKIIKPDFGHTLIESSRDKTKKQDSDKKDTHKGDEYPLFKLGQPRIPPFNGKHFEQWKMEVICLLRTKMYPDYAIVQAVRNSLQGDTRQILLTLKPTATTEQIIEKLTDIYGDIKTGDKVVQNFYSAMQKEGESSSVWGVRVETLFQRAVEKGEIDENKRDNKLKERFWRGLNSEKLKMATRVSYESTDTFEKLRRKARLEEEEEKKSIDEERMKKFNASISQQKESDEKLNMLQELLDRLKTIETDVSKLKGQNQQANNRGYHHRGYYRGGFRGRNRGSRGRGDRPAAENEPNKVQGAEKNHLNEKELPSKGAMGAKK